MADPAANGLTLDALNLGEGVGPVLTLESLEMGEDAELLVRIVNLLSGPQAARLMCVNRLLKRAVLASQWPPWSPEPHILADGTVCEPLSGRYSAYVRPGDGWAHVCQVIADAPKGATLLMMTGVYEVAETIELSRLIYIFGNGATIRGGEALGNEPIFTCTAARGALVGLSLEAHNQYGYHALKITASAFWLQKCTFTGAEYGSGFDVVGPAACPTIIDCKFRGAWTACTFYNGACGTLRQCDVRGCVVGILVSGGGNRAALRIEGNAINVKKYGVDIDGSVDPSFTLGPGNAIHGGVRDVIDVRPGVPQPG